MKSKIKKTLSVFLSIMMLMGIFGGMNISYAENISGIFGYEILSDNTAEITGCTD